MGEHTGNKFGHELMLSDRNMGLTLVSVDIFILNPNTDLVVFIKPRVHFLLATEDSNGKNQRQASARQ